jgi:hypothetical protein
MFEIFVRRPDPVACKEGMVGGPAGVSAMVDTMYTITSGRFLLENAAALPVFHGPGTQDTVANNVPSSGIYLHGYHMTTDASWSGCHSTNFCFGHTPTLQELRTRHPEGYDWAFLFAPVGHQQTAEFFVGANVGATGVTGTMDPSNPSHLLGAFDFLAARTRDPSQDFLVYKTYTDTHRRAFWLELDSAAPWSRLPAAVRANRNVATNLVSAELVRASGLTLDLAAAGLRVAADEPLRLTLSPLVEPAFDPALVDPTGILQPQVTLRGDFSGFDWVRVLAGGAPSAGTVNFSASAVTLGPLAIGPVTAFEVWPVRAFTDIGQGLAGSLGIPVHTGSGSLQPGSTTDLVIAQGQLAGLSALVFGYTTTRVPLFGGTLVPTPDIVLLGTNDASGRRQESFLWPNGVPGNVHYWSQYVALDAGAPQGLAFSNAMQWTTRP